MKAATKRPRARRSEPKTTRAVPSADFLDHFTDAVLILDRDRKVVFVNPAAEELTGQPESLEPGALPEWMSFSRCS